MTDDSLPETLSDDFFERMRREDPEQYRRLLDSLPDVRDGLNRQQRALLHTMHRMNLTHDAHMKSTAMICGRTPWIAQPEKPPQVLKAKLRSIRFPDPADPSAPKEEERYYTPDLGI